MAPIDLRMTAVRSEVLTGEPIDVAITIHNHSPQPVAIPDPSGPIQFQFRLRTAGGELVRTIDAVAAISARTIDTFPMPERNTIDLAPGSSADYPQTLEGPGYIDVAAMAPLPIAPGRYLLSAAYESVLEDIESAGVPLEVRAPAPVSIAAAFGAFSVNRILVHAARDGSAVILQGEGRTENPLDGLWERRASLPGAAVSVAAAAPPELGDAVWFAWLGGGAISCGLAQDRSLHLTVGPQPVGLEGAVLYPLGWQRSRDAAVFLAIGKDAVAVAAVSAAHKSIEIRRVQLAMVGRAAHWAVRYRADGSAEVIAAAEQGNGIALVRQTVALDSGVVEAPQTLLSRPHPLAALAVDQAGGAVEALFGPTDAQHHYTYVRLMPGANTPPAEFSFRAPLDALGKDPLGWALAGSTEVRPPIAAMLPGRVVALRAFTEPKWESLAESVAPRLLRMYRGKGADWAIWADAQAGVMVRAVR